MPCDDWIFPAFARCVAAAGGAAEVGRTTLPSYAHDLLSTALITPKSY